MKESTQREQILSAIRNALIEKLDNPYKDVDLTSDIYHTPEAADEPSVLFAKELIAAGGQFMYCENERAFLEYLQAFMQQKKWTVLSCRDAQLSNLLTAGNIDNVIKLETDDMEVVGITPCESLIARTGTVMVSSKNAGGRTAYAYPDVHIVKAYASQVVMSIKEAFAGMRIKYPEALPSQITMITGPSRTADIEKTLVMGAHGPRSFCVFMIDDV